MGLGETATREKLYGGIGAQPSNTSRNKEETPIAQICFDITIFNRWPSNQNYLADLIYLEYILNVTKSTQRRTFKRYISQRFDLARQKGRPAIRQIHGKEIRPYRDAIAAIINHYNSIPKFCQVRNRLEGQRKGIRNDWHSVGARDVGQRMAECAPLFRPTLAPACKYGVVTGTTVSRGVRWNIRQYE